jgi:3-dehydroquinate dehydratase-2
MLTNPSSDKAHILIAQGVNLDLLGTREPEIYGSDTLATIEAMVRQASPDIARLFGWSAPELCFFQSNHESLFLEKLSEGWSGALINPGAWTHTSLALADRLAALRLPFVEVHLSNLSRRESFRQHSYASPHALGVCYGFGATSYLSALTGLYAYLAKTLQSKGL